MPFNVSKAGKIIELSFQMHAIALLKIFLEYVIFISLLQLFHSSNYLFMLAVVVPTSGLGFFFSPIVEKMIFHIFNV